MFTQLTKEQETTKQIDVEWGQLQLEQSTWAMHARIERIASGYLHMAVPPPSRVRVVTLDALGGVRSGHQEPVSGKKR